VKILRLPSRVFHYYRTHVKDNEDITKDQASRKLTRNVQLAKEIPPRNELDTYRKVTKCIITVAYIL
jgi:hypothetical protein